VNLMLEVTEADLPQQEKLLRFRFLFHPATI
jgi:hypothetical protein